MKHKLAIFLLGALSFSTWAQSSPDSSFQYSCSNIAFAYDGSDATVTAMCLDSKNKPQSTSLKLMNISTHKGVLTTSQGESDFQLQCGSIRITAEEADVTLYATCNTGDGEFIPSSYNLNGIANQDGKLIYVTD